MSPDRVASDCPAVQVRYGSRIDQKPGGEIKNKEKEAETRSLNQKQGRSNGRSENASINSLRTWTEKGTWSLAGGRGYEARKANCSELIESSTEKFLHPIS
jgi:hypothetical protein